MKPSLPKGTRDLSPDQVEQRQYIFQVIREEMTLRGYRPLETPAMENLSTLTGKYGDEGDQLLFKVLNNGEFLEKADAQALADRDSRKLIPSIAKRGMRYDLTVPFARFVTMNQHALSFPFKRYQIQPVWRADRPQKGRYQEFYQCDADVIGSTSLVYEAELIQIYDAVFTRLKLPVAIHLNHRKILSGLANVCGLREQFVLMTTSIDKVDKIGWDGVKADMIRQGIGVDQAERVVALMLPHNQDQLLSALTSDPDGCVGLQELAEVEKYLQGSALHQQIVKDWTLARGLTYYTGAIIEVKPVGFEMGSLGGGGRYADLTGLFGLPGMSGVGISFGADRIFDVMEGLGIFPEKALGYVQVLVMALDATCFELAWTATQQLRLHGIKADIYPEASKIQKMMKYANGIQATNVLIIGLEEQESGLFTLRDMHTGSQLKLDLEKVIAHITE